MTHTRNIQGCAAAEAEVKNLWGRQCVGFQPPYHFIVLNFDWTFYFAFDFSFCQTQFSSS